MSGHAKRMVQSARRRRRGAIEAVAAAAATSIALSAPIASATSGYYVGPSNGNWNSAANWAATSGGAGGVGVPGDGDFAVLDSPANTTVNFDGSFSTGLSTFWIGSSGAANPTLNIAAGTVRYNNVADFYGMLLGKGGQGTISLSGTGALNVTGNEEVGWDNTGTFIQSGGTHTVDNSHAMLLGRFAAASGSYLLSGGSLNAGSEYVGYDGSGTFTQTGGTNTVYANLFIAGDALGSSGSYTISNGTLLADFIGVSGGVNDPGGTAALTVNSGGHVTLTATPLNTAVSVLRLFGGGTVTVNTGGLITGGSVWDDGTFNFNGGSATFASGANVGLTNTGVFNQTVAGTTLVNGGNLQVGSNTGANGTYTLAGAGTVVSVSLAEYIGNGGAGTFNQSGGSNSLALELRIGEQASGNGTYNLSAGSVTAGESEFIANLGVASFNQTGGTNNANGLRVASGVGSIASYSLGGTGSVSITGASAFENIGESGLGIFNQSAGTHSVSGAVAISQYAGSRGIYNLSGGTYSISSDLNIGGQGIGTNANLNISGGAISVTGTAGIGSSTGNATLSQSAGTSTVGQLIVGGSAGSAGVVLLSGGALNGGVVENIGSSGSAIFNQTGGTHNTSEIFLSANGTNNSAYLMSGGNLNVNVAGNPNNLYVGGSAGASFVQSGGAVTVGATLDLAHTAGEHGSYTLSGAGSLSAASEYIGDTGVGTFVQSGGTNTTQFIDLSAVNGSDASTYRLSGGTLLVNSATANVFIGDFASGSFIQSGGTFSQTNNGLYLGRSAAGQGTYTLSGGLLTVPTENVGGFGQGVFTQSGGTNTVSAALSISFSSFSTSGTFSMQGGALSAGTIAVASTFNQTGGNVSAGAGPIQIFGGGGTYIISGGGASAANLYVGGDGIGANGAGTLTINGGSVTASSATTVYSGGAVHLNAGTLNLQGTTAISGGLTGSAGMLAIGNGAAVNINGSAGNSFSGFTVVNNGTLTLNNSSGNAIDGKITIGDGTIASTLLLSADNQIADSAIITVNAGSTFDVNHFSETIGELLLTGGSVLHSGNLTVTNSSVAMSDGSSISSATTLFHGIAYSTAGGLSGATVSGNVTLPVGDHVFATARNGNVINDLIVSSVVSGTGNVLKAGPGVVLLSGGSANTYTGNTTILQGTLRLGKAAGVTAVAGNLLIAGGTASLSSSNQIADASIVTIYSGGTFDMAGASETVAAITGDGAVNLSTGTLNLGGDNSSSTFSGVITGAGNFNKNGTGRLALNGSNNFTGRVNVNAGFLQLGNPLALGSSTLAAIVAQGAAIDLNGQFLGGGANGTGLSIRGTGPDGQGALINSAAGTIANKGGHAMTLAADATIGGPGEIDISTVVNGNGILTKAGTGTLVLSGNNTFGAGFSINSGLVQFTTVNSIGTGTVTLNGGQLQAMMSSQTVGGPPIALGAAGGTISAGNSNLWFYNNAISGSGPLTIDTPYTVLFNGSAANTYTGNTTIKRGTLSAFRTGAGALVFPGNLTIGDGINLATLQAGSNGAIASSSAVTLNHSGTLDLQNSTQTIGSLSGADGTVVLGGPGVGGGTLFIGLDNSSTTYAGVITGNGSIAKVGGGTLTLAGKNDFTGGITLSSGTLSFSMPANLGTGTSITFNGNGTLAATASTTLQRDVNVAMTGGVSVLAGDSLTLTGSSGANGALSGSGTLTKTGAGTLLLVGPSSGYSGTLSIAGGIVNVSTAGALSGAASSVQLDGGTFQADGSFTLSRAINLTANGGNVDVTDGHVFTAGVIGGNGGWSKTGFGQMQLAGGSTYGGATTIAAGTLALAPGGSMPSNSPVVINAGATFDVSLASSPVVGALSGNGAVIVGPGGLNIASNSPSAFPGTIGGGGGVVKSGSATLTLSGANTYTGPTTIAGGTLAAGIANAIPAASYISMPTAGATFDMAGFSQSIVSLYGVSGTGVTNSSATPVTLQLNVPTGGEPSANFSGVISGNISLVSNNTFSSQALAGANTYTGSTTINGVGGIYINTNDSLPTSTDLIIGPGASFNTSGFDQTVGSLSGSGSVQLSSGSITIAGSSSTTFDGIIDDLGNSGRVNKNGSGTLTLTAANTFKGGVTIIQGTISVAADNNLGLGGRVTLDSGGALQTTASFDTSRPFLFEGGAIDVSGSTNTLTVNGAVSGSSAVKIGAGTLVFSGNNSFGGTLDVEAGTLRASGAAAIPANLSAIVAGGATLDLSATGAGGPGGSVSFAALSGAGNVVLPTFGTLTLNGSTPSTFAGVLSGATGSFASTGASALTLTSHSTYGGTTTISSGTVRLGIDNALPVTTTFVSAAPGGTLDLNGFNQQAAGPTIITNSAATLSTFTIGSGSVAPVGGPAPASFSGTIGGNTALNVTSTSNVWQLTGGLGFTGGLTVNGAGLRLSNAQSFTGGIAVINGGTLQADSDSALGGAGNTVALSSGTLAFGGSFASARAIALAGGGGTIGVISAGDVVTYSGNISGSTGLTKTGAGTFSIVSAPIVGGTVSSSGGVLKLSGADAALPGATLLAPKLGGTIAVDESAGLHAGNRFSDAADLLLSGGTFSYTGAGGTAVSESLRHLIVAGGPKLLPTGGASTISLTAGNNGTGKLIFTAGLDASGRQDATVNFVASNLGTTNKVTLTGQAGGFIGGWATVNGADFATYDNVTNQSVMAFSGYFNGFTNAGAGDNVRITGPATITGLGTTTINSLKLDTTGGAISVSQNAGSLLMLVSGGLLQTGGNTATIGVADLTSGGSEIDAYVGGSLNLTGRLVNNASLVSLVKSGPGVLTLGGGVNDIAGNTFTGNTFIHQGELDLNKAGGPGAYAIQGSIVITGGTLKELRSNQINPTAGITLTAGSLDFGANASSISSFANFGGAATISSTFTVSSSTLAGGTTTVQAGGVMNVTGVAGGGGGPAGGGASIGGHATGTPLIVTGGTNEFKAGATLKTPSILFSGANATLQMDAGSSSTPAGGIGPPAGPALALINSATGSDTDITVSSGSAAITSTTPAAGQNPGQLDLGGVTRGISLSPGTSLQISTRIVNGGIKLSGDASGVLQLTAANTYGGGTNIVSGTVQASDPAALGGGAVTFSGGTLALRSDAGSATFGQSSVAASGAMVNIDLGPATPGGSAVCAFIGGAMTLEAAVNLTGTPGESLTVPGVTLHNTVAGNPTAFHNSADLIINGGITQTGSVGDISKDGTGTLSFGGATSNSFTGTTTVSGGTLSLAKTGGAIAVPHDLTITSGGTVRLAASNQIAAASHVTLNAGGGSPAELDLGIFTNTIGATSPFGLSFVAGGTLTTSAGGSAVLGGDVEMTGASGIATIAGNLDLGGGGRTFNVATAALNMNVTANITGGGSSGAVLSKTGPGTLALSGASTFGGAGRTINIAGGLLRAASDASLGNAGNSLVITSGAALQAAGTFTSPRSVNIGAGGGGFDVPSLNTFTLNGVVSGSNGMIKSGAGTLVLGGANTFTGNVTINGGVVNISANVNLGPDSNNVVLNGGQLVPTAVFQLAHAITFGGGGATLDAETNSPVTLSSTVGGAGLTKTGAGVLTINGTQNWSDGALLYDTAGTVNLNTSAGSSVLSLRVGSGAATNLNNVSQSLVGLRLDAGGMLLANGGGVSFSGDLVLNGTGGQINAAQPVTIGANGNTTLTGTLAKSGSSLLTFNRSSGLVTVNPGAIISINQGTLNVSGSDPFTSSLQTSTHAAIANSGTFSVTGSGVAVSIASVSGAGVTSVSAGATLTVGSSPGPIGQSSLSVAGALATNGGNGTAYGPVTLSGSGPTALSITGAGAAQVGDVTFTGLEGGGTIAGGAMTASSIHGGSIAMTGGSVAIRPNGTAAGQSVLTSLSITGGGHFDVADNQLLVNATLDNVRAMVNAGALFTSAGNGAALGYADAGGGVINAKYVLSGDANLDGAVNVGDLGALATNYGVSGSAIYWQQGDFDHNGLVNVGDLGALATNYGKSLAGGSGGAASSEAMVASPTAVGSSQAVPEPASVVLLGLMPLLQRRRRGRP